MSNKLRKHIVVRDETIHKIKQIINNAIKKGCTEILITLRGNGYNDENIVTKNLDFFKDLLQKKINIQFNYTYEQNEENDYEEELPYIPLKKALDAEDFLARIADEIKQKNFSQFEQYIAIFNVVNRLKPYKMEYDYEARRFAKKAIKYSRQNPDSTKKFEDVDEDFDFEVYGLPLEEYIKYYKRKPQSQSLSRAIYRVIDSDKMCCAGYSAVFENLARRLNLNVAYITLDFTDVNEGHSMIYANIKDKKYDIDGYYVIDPTGSVNIYESPDPLYEQLIMTTDEARAGFEGTINVHSFDGFLTAEKPKIFISELINNNNVKSPIHLRRFIKNLDPELYKYLADNGFNEDITIDNLLYMMNYFKTKINHPVDKKRILEAIINVKKKTLKNLTEIDFVDMCMDMSIYSPFSTSKKTEGLDMSEVSLFGDRYNAYIKKRCEDVKNLSEDEIKEKYPFLNLKELEKYKKLKNSRENQINTNNSEPDDVGNTEI